MDRLADALKAVGPPAIPLLVKRLDSSLWSVRHRASDVLAHIGTPAVPHLVDALEDESFLVREVAAKTLGKIGSKKALGSLRKVAAGDSHEPVRRAAKEALLRINNINNGSGKGRSRRF